MHYYLYQITNLVNNKIYVGVHKTHNLDDGYMGSGKVIRSAIEKYGIENFKKDILETFESSESMYAREREVVTEEFLARDDVYNLRRGGTGGFDYINKNLTKTQLHKRALSGRQATNKILSNRYGAEWKSIVGNLGAKASIHKQRRNGTGIFDANIRLLGCKAAQTIESATKRKHTLKEIRHQQGNKNSQFGTMWITDGCVNKKINRSSVLPDGWMKGRTFK